MSNTDEGERGETGGEEGGRRIGEKVLFVVLLCYRCIEYLLTFY